MIILLQKYDVSLLYGSKMTTFKMMKSKLLIFRGSFLFVLFLVALSSCDEKSGVKGTPIISLKTSDNAQQDAPEISPFNLAARIRSTDDLTLLFETIEDLPILDQFISDKGPYTLFAPSNEALEEIEILEGGIEIENLLKKYMVMGKITTVELTKSIRSSGGSYSMNTIGGTTLIAYKVGNAIYIKTINGKKSELGKSDILASNGIIHVANSL